MSKAGREAVVYLGAHLLAGITLGMLVSILTCSAVRHIRGEATTRDDTFSALRDRVHLAYEQEAHR